jgi:pimeloyl-ACP methyl ester carboxylesterase
VTATFVLVHGGSMTSRFWDRLIPLLEAPAVAVDLPGRAGKVVDMMAVTVDDGVESVLTDLHAAGIDGAVVVVAHSSGGLVVPGVVAGLDGRTRHIVLNAASVPPEGGCGLDCMQPRHREGVEAFVTSVRESGQVATTPIPEDPERLRTSYGGNPLDDATLAFIADPSRVVTDSFNTYYQPVHWSLIGDTPVTYVRNLHDRPIPLAMQDEMAARLPGVNVVDMDTGHIPPVTHPAAFAAICNAVLS